MREKDYSEFEEACKIESKKIIKFGCLLVSLVLILILVA